MGLAILIVWRNYISLFYFVAIHLSPINALSETCGKEEKWKKNLKNFYFIIWLGEEEEK